MVLLLFLQLFSNYAYLTSSFKDWMDVPRSLKHTKLQDSVGASCWNCFKNSLSSKSHPPPPTPFFRYLHTMSSCEHWNGKSTLVSVLLKNNTFEPDQTFPFFFERQAPRIDRFQVVQKRRATHSKAPKLCYVRLGELLIGQGLKSLKNDLIHERYKDPLHSKNITSCLSRAHQLIWYLLPGSHLLLVRSGFSCMTGVFCLNFPPFTGQR